MSALLNPLDGYPELRKLAYQVYGALVILLGALSVGFASYGGRPQWLSAAIEVAAYLGGALGLTAAANVTNDMVGKNYPELPDADTENFIVE